VVINSNFRAAMRKLKKSSKWLSQGILFTQGLFFDIFFTKTLQDCAWDIMLHFSIMSMEQIYHFKSY